MPPVVRAYDLVDDLRTRAELLRQSWLDKSVLGLVRANMIEANAITLGIGGNVGVSPGALTAGDDDSLVDFPPGTLTLGTANSLIDIPPGTLSVGAEVLVPTSAITNTMLAPDSVTTSKVSANAIGANEIAANAIVAGKIAAGAVTTGKINAGAVTADKIDVTKLSTIKANLGTITNVESLDTTSGVPHLHFDQSQFIVRNAADDRAILIDWSGTSQGAQIEFGFRKSWNLSTPGINFKDLGLTPDYLYGYLDTYWDDFDALPDRYKLRLMLDSGPAVVVEGGGQGVSVRNGSGGSAYNWAIDNAGEMWSDAYNTWSDERHKEDIRPLESRGPDLRKLRPIRYRGEGKSRERMGFSAQEVAAVFPELAIEAPATSDGTGEPSEPRMGVNLSDLVTLLVQGFQELSQDHEELSDEVDNLKAKK